MPYPAVPGSRASRVALAGPRPEGRHVAVPGAHPARTLLVALTVAPRLLLQVGGCQGCRRPGRPGTGGSTEQAYNPQVTSHPERGGGGSDWLASERTNRDRRDPSAGHCSPLPGGGLPRPAKRELSGQGRGGTAGARHPIGPRREEAGPGGAGLLLGPCTSPDPAPAPGARFAGHRGKLSSTEAREG